MSTRSLVRTGPTSLATREDRLRRSGEAAQRFVDHSRAKSSRRAYESDQAHFVAWCAGVDRCALPATPETVALYFAALATGDAEAFAVGRATRREHWSAPSIMRRKSSIGRMHGLADLPDPTTHERVLTVLKGIRRDLTMRQERRRPLLSEHVCALASLWSSGSARDVRDRALVSAGFMFAGRRSEIRDLLIEHLEFTDEGVVVFLARRKNDQEGVGMSVGVPARPGLAACPVAALRAWLALLGATTGALFRPVAGAHALARAMNTSEVERVVRRAAADLGLEPAAEYGAHSLRAGFVTSATRAGKSTEWIMARTGHRSPAMVRRYVRDARLFDREPHDELLGVT